ncbi:MAG: FAD-binding protein [Candidatus Heimdallarchaeota archaeon]|nr:FAD-binding protein [Candidatus Heimdallarchaeota archaeon]
MTKWDYTTDVLIVGSGGGGMTAALVAKKAGLDVTVIEKSECYGGSTALSGGGVWIPNNYILEKKGIVDSMEKARTYMDNTVGDRVPSEFKEAYLVNAPKMIDWLRENTKTKFIHVPNYSDYHPERPGGIPQGRALEGKPFNGRKLKKDLQYLNTFPYDVPLGISFSISEYHNLGMIMSTWAGKWTALKAGMRAIFGLLIRYRHLTLGGALIGRLRKSMLDENIPLWLNTPFEDLILDKGKIVGVIAKKEDSEIRIKAEKGVILAAGGFPHNLEMREKYHPKPITTEWTSAHSGNTGDAILSGMKHGAAVDLMEDAWWGPSSVPPDELPFFHVGERGYPGGIMVNKAGKRFTNESASYVVVVHEMYKKHSKEIPHIPCYFIFDQRFKSKYMFGMVFPGMKFPEKYFESGYIKTADTLEELAEKIDVNAKNLSDTVKCFNDFAKTGKDEDFGRGDSAYDHYYGDPNVKPNPNLFPLEKPPFYAVEFVPGDLGTKGGLVTNEHAQVLRKDGSVIEGLYAVGNSSSSVMGNSYPGPGATVGPTMTFGYVAAKHISEKK